MVITTEQFMLENASRYQRLVKDFKLPAKPVQKTITQTNPDVVICTRIRPLLEQETEQGIPEGVFVRSTTNSTIDAHELRQMVRGPPVLKSSTYEVDRCFGPDVGTEQIYDNLMKDLVPWAWAGNVATLFAYGQTGSGKTYTVSHLEQLVASQLMGGKLPGKRRVFVTIVELAQNSAFDLLNSRKTVSILEDSFGVTQIAGAADHEVSTADELLACIESAASYRRTEATIKNDTSSRSHAICRIRIQNPNAPADEDGMLYMVDLAGSEAARDRVNHDAERMREARQINTSLSVLKDCIRGRAEADMAAATGSKKKPYVPFRQSSLTKVLKHVFDPAGTRSCRTIIIACVNPSLLDIVASRNTLRYAEMLRVLMPKASTIRYDPKSPMTWTNEQLRKWIEENSGSPAIDSKILAPEESGAQLLRLPPADFEARCLKTKDVKPEQAKAFRAKLWQFHVDSKVQRTAPQPAKNDGVGMSDFMEFLSAEQKSSSRHPNNETAKLPFKERIRPGMAVSWTQNWFYGQYRPNSANMAVLLCPASAAGPHAMDLNDKTVESQLQDEQEGGKSKKWLCAYINPGMLHESYEVQLWRQVVIAEDQMDAEILLEYDAGTRYYFITL